MYTQRKHLHTRWLMTKDRHTDGIGGCQLHSTPIRVEWQLTEKQSTWRKRVQCHTVHHTPYNTTLGKNTVPCGYKPATVKVWMRPTNTILQHCAKYYFQSVIYRHWEEWLVVISTQHPVMRHTLKVLACNVPSALCSYNAKRLRNLVTREEHQRRC